MPHNVPGAGSEPPPTTPVGSQHNVIIRNNVNPHSPIRESVGGVQQQDVSEVPVQSQVLADGVHQSEGNDDDIQLRDSYDVPEDIEFTSTPNSRYLQNVQNVAIPADMLGGQNSADMLDQNLNDVRSGEVSQEYEVSEDQEVGSSRDQVQPGFESHRVLSLPSLPSACFYHGVFRIKV
ncbi:hypothetical protein V6N13_140419 [Hibiscus sabdariffa]